MTSPHVEALVGGLAWFPVQFLALWVASVTVVSWLGGHMLLLARFPPVDERPERVFRFVSGQMRAARYGAALYVGLGRRGLHVAPALAFRPPLFFRGIPCIPWSELRCAEAQGTRGRRGADTSRFEIPRLGLRFSIVGPAGRAIEERLGATEPAPGV